MLTGLAPLIIFTFPLDVKGPTFNALSGIPVIGSSLASQIGLPIPIYLDERLTGVYIDQESRNIDIETTVEPKSEGTTPDFSQRGTNNTVTINMKALKTSVALTALLALIDLAFQKTVSRSYKVTYLNGPTTIFNGLLDGFSTATDNDNELVFITLTLSKANQVLKPTAAVPVLAPLPGAIPV